MNFKYLKTAYRYWMKFAHTLGWINSQIILTVLYFFLIGVYSFIAAVVGLIRRKRVQQVGWLVKKYEKPAVEVLKRQF